MKKLLSFFLLLVLLYIPVNTIFADSRKAYDDYLYQFDVYRQKYNDFKVAKNEYEKFHTLTSQTEALEKTKLMLASRDILLKTYLIVLSEKLAENRGMRPLEKQLYINLINNENTFLDNHRIKVDSIGSLDDTVEVSKELESHYKVLSVSIRQTIIGLTLGDLNLLSESYDRTFNTISDYLNSHREFYTQSKLIISDRWIISITDKRNLFQQKYNEVANENAKMKAVSIEELDQNMNQLRKKIDEAKTYLSEGNSYMKELLRVLKYAD